MFEGLKDEMEARERREMSKMRALYDQIIVKAEKVGERKLESGLILPATAASQDILGQVVAIGDGLPRSDGSLLRPRLEVGDQVLFKSQSAVLFSFEGEQYAKLGPQGVLAVIAPDG
jgi:chaperonin GroES